MRRFLLALVLLLPACSAAQGSTALPAPVWRTSAAQPMNFVRPAPARDETCRQVLRLSAGGSAVRLRLSNLLGEQPLVLSAVTAGLRAERAAVRPGSLRQVTLGGVAAFSIPPGESVTTDPVRLPAPAGADLAVSFAVAGTAVLTGHRVAAHSGWCSGPGTGDRTREEGGAAFREPERAAFVLEEAAVAAPASGPDGVVVTGDSLTDAPMPADVAPRWPEVLAARLPGTPVANAAIAGNRVLLEGGYGRPLVERFARDVLQRSGSGTVVLLAGTNDLARDLSAAGLRTALTRLCQTARADGLRVVLATIPPADERTAAQRAARREVNAWIRGGAPADLVVDADEVLRDSSQPERLAAAYDYGDGLHLSPAGHRALGEAVAEALG